VTSTVRIESTFAATRETTWAAIEHLETHVTWMADAVAITFVTEQHAGVGTRFDCATRIGPIRLVDAMSITRWVPGEAMGVDHVGVVRGTGVFSLDWLGDQLTRFSWEEQLSFPWWLGGVIGEWVARPFLTHIWRGNLARLKSIVEASQQGVATA
jgi:hypothetical protein